jgi:hypothetical protein
MGVSNGTQLAMSSSMQRRWQRFRLDLPLRIIVHREKTTIVNGRGSDISEGGILIFAGVELKDGDEIFVEFTPPYSGDPIRVRGVVRNRAGYKYGVEFLWLNAEEHEQTAKFRSLLRLATTSVM